MMEITERANKYADGKANEAITTAIAQAYMDGYRDGYKDREEELPIDLRDKKTEYVDLGLPSGTQWSTDYERDENDNILYLPYGEASKLKLPTMEQWQEIKNKCDWLPNFNGVALLWIDCVGPNGNSIRFYTRGQMIANELKKSSEVHIWINDEEPSATGNPSEIVIRSSSYNNNIVKDEYSLFSDYKLPVRLVK